MYSMFFAINDIIFDVGAHEQLTSEYLNEKRETR